MGLRFAALGSGSRGNALLVESDDTLLMVDCGFSVADTEKRLRRMGREPEQVTGILVTHEHSDHISGAARFSRCHEVPVWMTPGTYVEAPDRDFYRLNLLNCHQALQIESIQVAPFPVPHDAREPCQFVFEGAGRRLGVLTDTGHITQHIRESLETCHAVALEFNHDLESLWGGRYPESVKTRVAGPLGHLNNRQAADLLSALDRQTLSWVVGLHLSEQNNAADKVSETVEEVAKDFVGRLSLADQSEGIGWRPV